MKKVLFTSILVCYIHFLYCQSNYFFSQESEEDSFVLDTLDMNNPIINLNDGTIYTVDIKSPDNSRYYDQLESKIIKPYEYARESSLIYSEILRKLDTIHKKSERKKFIKKSKNVLDDTFRAKLVKMTRWQGEIFIKLIHRNTSKTVAEIIKEHRGGLALLVFQTKAGLFNLDLDTPYQPSTIREDKYLEVLIAEMISKGKLNAILPNDKPQKSLDELLKKDIDGKNSR